MHTPVDGVPLSDCNALWTRVPFVSDRFRKSSNSKYSKIYKKRFSRSSTTTTATTSVLAQTNSISSDTSQQKKNRNKSSLGSKLTLKNSNGGQIPCTCYRQRTCDEDNQTVKQVIKMLVAVIVLFIFCWTPTLTLNVLRAFNLIDEINEGILKEIATGTLIMENKSLQTNNFSMIFSF